MAGFYRLLAYSVKSMIVANASGALVRRAAGVPAAHRSPGSVRCRKWRDPRFCSPKPRMPATSAPTLPQALLFLMITNGFSIVR